jgi:hypothetical protein
VETLGVAMRAYVSARADLEAAPQSAGAASKFAIAANRLAEAAQAARAPIAALETLVRTAP